MKRIFFNTALICGFAVSVSPQVPIASTQANAQEVAQGGKNGGGKSGGQGGDKGGQGGDRGGQGGGRSQPGGAGAQPSRGGGNAPRSGQQGGNSGPSNTAPRQSPGRSGQQPSINRTPSFSRPNTSGSRGTTPRQPAVTRPGTAPRTGEANRSGNPGQRSGDNVRVGTPRSGNFPSGIRNRPYAGNTINLNNRQFNLGNNRYQPAYYRHSGYHGYWNGNRGFGSGVGIRLGNNLGLGFGGGYGTGWGIGNGYGGRYGGYGYRPLGWGMGGWGLGALNYNSGYLGYSNPYYSNVGVNGYNYSQPIPVSYYAAQEVDQNDPNSAEAVMNNAVAAFQQNDYDAALDITNQGIARFSDDAVLHEFRSLVLFARHDYQQAAATIHSVLAVGPGWDWTTLSNLYSSVGVYTEQLRALEAFTRANPDDAASRFLLAYHYMSTGYPEASARELRHVVRLKPNDRVAADVLRLVADSASEQSGQTVQQPTAVPPRAETLPAPRAVDPAMLVGTWRAARPDGSRFSLVLADDAQFTWSFTPKDQKPQTFSGTYTVEANVVALERADGGSLIAEVTPSGNGKFNFKLVGAPEEDPGLDFNR